MAPAIPWVREVMRSTCRASLRLQPLIEARRIDDDAFVRSLGYKVVPVVCSRTKRDLATVNTDHFAMNTHSQPGRRCGEVRKVDVRTDRLLLRPVEEWLDSQLTNAFH